jgi:tetratricopeptide (TPR) repeat protein
MDFNDWNDAERRVERAQELFEQHKWLEALDELRAATAINPYNSAWFFNTGLTLDELGRFEEAIDAYEHALRIEPNDIQCLQHLGIDLHQVGRFEEALRSFERIQEIEPSYEPSYCSRILTYAELGEHDRAEEMFYTARLFREHCPQCYYNMGVSLFARAEYGKAVYCWNRTLDMDGQHPLVHVRIAEALWNKGRLQEARQHYLCGLRQDPGSVATLLDLSDLLIEMRRWDEAGEKIRRAIEMSPDDPAAHYCHGRWLARRAGTVQAETALRHALELDPTFPGAHLELARIHLRQHRLDDARQHVRAELLLRPQDPSILLDLSNLLVDIDDLRAAIACLKRLVQVQPSGAIGWQNLAVAQFMRRRFEEGIASTREALRLDPRNIMAIHNLALAYGQMRRYDDAIAQTRHGLELSPRNTALQALEFRLRLSRLWARITGAPMRMARIFGR